MQTNKILNTRQPTLRFQKHLIEENKRYSGSNFNCSPLEMIEEFEDFLEFVIGDFEKMLVQSDRIEINYKNAILFLTW